MKRNTFTTELTLDTIRSDTYNRWKLLEVKPEINSDFIRATVPEDVLIASLPSSSFDLPFCFRLFPTFETSNQTNAKIADNINLIIQTINKYKSPEEFLNNILKMTYEYLELMPLEDIYQDIDTTKLRAYYKKYGHLIGTEDGIYYNEDYTEDYFIETTTDFHANYYDHISKFMAIVDKNKFLSMYPDLVAGNFVNRIGITVEQKIDVCFLVNFNIKNDLNDYVKYLAAFWTRYFKSKLTKEKKAKTEVQKAESKKQKVVDNLLNEIKALGIPKSDIMELVDKLE